MTTFVLPDQPYALRKGAHTRREDGMCIQELLAYLAGQPHSDMPPCVAPTIRRFTISLNDRLDDERRQLLLPYALRMLGTADDGREEERRQLCSQWLLHHALPLYLDKAGRKEAAQRLRDLPGDLAVEGVTRAIREARDEAWAARSDACDRLRDRILEELKKRGMVADAAADAVADAVAVAVADADAVAVADAAAKSYWAIRDAVYGAVRKAAKAKAQEFVREANADLLPSALDLLDRMLPPEPLCAPKVPNAEVICGITA